MIGRIEFVFENLKPVFIRKFGFKRKFIDTIKFNILLISTYSMRDNEFQKERSPEIV